MLDLFGLSPWLQVPLVLLVALPLAGVVAAALLRVVDWFARVTGRK